MTQTITAPPEVVQAQVAHFAESLHPANNEYVLNNLEDISQRWGGPITRIAVETEVIETDDEVSLVSAGDEITVATSEQVQDYTGRMQESAPENLQLRIEMQQAYEPYKQAVAVLKKSLETPNGNGANDATITDVTKHPNHLGAGGNSDVYKIQVEGKDCIVRLPLSGKQRTIAELEKDYVIPGIRSKGLDHIEQTIAYSYEDGVVISEVMTGKHPLDLTAQEVAAVTDDQLQALLQTVLTAYDAGVLLDSVSGNAFYTEQDGFGFIDVESIDSDLKKYVSKGTFAGAISGIFLDVEASTHFWPRSLAQVEYLGHAIELVERYGAICKAQLPEHDYVAAKKQLDDILLEMNTQYNNELVKHDLKDPIR